MNLQQISASREALTDAVLIRAGLRSPHSATNHPHAAQLAASDTGLLRALATVLGSTGGMQGMSAAGAQGRGIGTSEFASALADVMRSASVAGLNPHVAHRAWCDLRTLPNFRPQQFPMVDFDPALAENPELAEVANVIAVADSSGLTASIRTYGVDVPVSRELVQADDIDLLAGVSKRLGVNASHLEAAAAYALLEANTTLADNEALFHASHGNTMTGALSETTLGQGMCKLRMMTTPGGAIANLDARFLIVDPNNELLARRLVRDAGLEIQVVASAWVAAPHWYLLADPKAAPVIALLHLPGGGDVNFGKTKTPAEYDGVLMGARFDFGAVPVGRLGAVYSTGA